MTYQREFTKRLRIGIVGLGRHSYRNILPAMHYLPVQIAAVCDINEDLAKLTALQFGCRHYSDTARMYGEEELDAVFLCVSPQLHPKLTMDAFDRGISVWMEKPVAMRVHEVEEMISRKNGHTAVVGYKKAFMPSTEKAIEIVNSEQYGQHHSSLAVYPMTIPDNGQEVLDSGSYVNWLANGIHPLSLLIAVSGKVEAVTVRRNASGRGVCLLDFANGVAGNFHFASGPQPIESYRFFGESWHLEIENSLRVKLQRGIPFDYESTHNYIPQGTDSGAVIWEPQNCLATLENKAIFTQGMYGEMKYFCDCVLENRQAERGSLEFALEVMKVYEAALLSNGKTRVI
ncbi:Gfo/Idh/MocA family protein [Paenibacillus roseipurpureus]|uniref:Gfo/Idh/MocA family oxidoreductase n=1 Tax=Paenibacillus roseopurpureus TaxID=2918901 RepID=A0AA96LRT1_9BACL|nr:Gfo/Idh/MocA family oxidoreductase [Paenibacillus sp. MBLB1832]WNR46049.1 Gfo/Idh/MocA family oxidoreductase [Paenibacillus sp. MBLB1832]